MSGLTGHRLAAPVHSSGDGCRLTGPVDVRPNASIPPAGSSGEAAKSPSHLPGPADHAAGPTVHALGLAGEVPGPTVHRLDPAVRAPDPGGFALGRSGQPAILAVDPSEPGVAVMPRAIDATSCIRHPTNTQPELSVASGEGDILSDATAQPARHATVPA